MAEGKVDLLISASKPAELNSNFRDVGTAFG